MYKDILLFTPKPVKLFPQQPYLTTKRPRFSASWSIFQCNSKQWMHLYFQMHPPVVLPSLLCGLLCGWLAGPEPLRGRLLWSGRCRQFTNIRSQLLEKRDKFEAARPCNDASFRAARNGQGDGLLRPNTRKTNLNSTATSLGLRGVCGRTYVGVV